LYYHPFLQGSSQIFIDKEKELAMAKKGVLALLLATMLAGGVFAQSDWGGKKNFASLDLGLLVGGVKYERLLTSKISVGVDVYWANSFIIFNEFEAGLFGRYYIWNGFFGELGLGVHTHSGIEDTEYEDYYGSTVTTVIGADFVVTSGVAISPGLGWKFDPGNAGGFFVEPEIIIPITIGPKTNAFNSDNDPGVGVGFVFQVALGWAF
jgi:hypothetical protein